MQTYSEFRPTGFDAAGAFLPDRQDWIVAPVCRTRDSGALEESNFETALEILGGESEAVEVHRFGHWGPGWFEIILVKPGEENDRGAALTDICDEIARNLENYPVLDEHDYCKREYEDASESWDTWACRDFRREIARQHDLSDAAADLLDEWEADNAFSLYMDLANDPYSSDGSGICFPCLGKVAGMIDRQDMARLLRKLRNGETEPYRA